MEVRPRPASLRSPRLCSLVTVWADSRAGRSLMLPKTQSNQRVGCCDGCSSTSHGGIAVYGAIDGLYTLSAGSNPHLAPGRSSRSCAATRPQLETIAQVPEGKTTASAAVVASSPPLTGQPDGAVAAGGGSAASSGKKRKLLEVKTMLLVAGADQNTDPAAIGEFVEGLQVVVDGLRCGALSASSCLQRLAS